MREKNRVISAAEPRNCQTPLPAGDSRQITSHPYAECTNRCHPPFAGSHWLLTAEKEGWQSIWGRGSWWDIGMQRPDLKGSLPLPGPVPNGGGRRRCQVAPDGLTLIWWVSLKRQVRKGAIRVQKLRNKRQGVDFQPLMRWSESERQRSCNRMNSTKQNQAWAKELLVNKPLTE